MVGDIKAINEAITVPEENGLVSEIFDGLQHYLSYNVRFLGEKSKLG